MREGLYESLISGGLGDELDRLADLTASTGPVDDADAPHVLARYVGELLEARLRAIRDPDERLHTVNQVVTQLAGATDAIAAPARQLLSIEGPAGPGRISVSSRPRTPLSDAALLTNSSDEPSLGAELRAEIDTADGVDLLCAFVKWYGLRLLEPELARARERGVPLRVITTTYMGATEREALDRLSPQFGATVKIQYDAHRTRLHAKAWMFRRNTTFDTAYVGSSNLSRAALLDGVEWNVRLLEVGTPALLEKFRATFDTYWNDSSFESYDPDRDRDRLDDALAEASGRTTHDRVTISLAGLEVRPFPTSRRCSKRLRPNARSMIVIGTSSSRPRARARPSLLHWTTETSVPTRDERPSLLFVAHRREILEQSLRTYREVLADASFGELYVGGARPERWRHVFASVQSLSSYGIATIPADAFDIVVVDEFHHAEAASYRRIIDHLEPVELLGLTATPERADGVDVRSFFGDRTAAELRLWDALGADLLCPFHYFVVADGTDLRGVGWTRGRYDEAELSNVYTGNNARAAIVLSQLRDKLLNPGAMRALGFCVSVAHAEFMARVFTEAGIPARAVSGTTPQADASAALDDLRNRRVNALFAADLFNEGLDLPEVDTVLFLRPTESATVFLQQLGRGLRRTRDKAVLTALDFVGHQNKQFRWDRSFAR